MCRTSVTERIVGRLLQGRQGMRRVDIRFVTRKCWMGHESNDVKRFPRLTDTAASKFTRRSVSPPKQISSQRCVDRFQQIDSPVHYR